MPQVSPTEGIYFDMDRLHISEPATSTPLKSTSSITLVHSDSIDQQFLKNPEASSSSLARTPPVAIKNPTTPSTVLAPPEGVKRRIPSGDGGYVIMSPGVAAQQEKTQRIQDQLLNEIPPAWMSRKLIGSHGDMIQRLWMV